MRRFPFTAGQVFSHFGLFFRSFFVNLSCCFFDRFWVVLGCHFGSFLGAKIDPRRAKLGSRRLLKRYFLKKVNFHEIPVKPMKNQKQSPQERPQNDPRSPQDGPKTILKRCFFRIDFCLRFWSVLGPILVPFRRHFRSPNRSFLASMFG